MTDGSDRHTRLTATPDDAGLRLDQFLVARLPDLSRSQVQRLIADGHVTVSRGRTKAGLAVDPGLIVTVDRPERRTAGGPSAESLPLSVLYEDDDLIVVAKPAGMVVHPAAGHASGTLVNALLHHAGGLSGVGGADRPGIVHRLDRGTSGVMVVAKHDRAHRALAAQFHDRRIEKEYLALVWGAPRVGAEFDKPIGRDPRDRKKMSTRARRTRAAASRVVDVEALGGVSWVRIAIATGRTHQIRVHLSEAGHAVVGDALYGGARRKLPPRFAALARIERPWLHAARLAFDHPTTGERLSFEAPVPAELDAILDTLRRQRAPRDREDS
ncbi:MAG TPA: RluA family pseudouridine synthase [Vicinamibacterales bacterium]|nr:RluA family pseudouridine synthase [Vicinamibacterales bacterium]